MSDSPRRPQWWLILVAAALAALMLYQNIGAAGGGVLFAAFLLGSVGWRFYRGRNPARPAAHRCLTCGETLSPTARECRHCGGARWTVEN
jgi:hypothetical protein